MPAKGKGYGKKKGKAHSKKTKSSSRAPDPTSDCIFPREIVSSILSRLPVKSLLRFRCVCKPWLKLISKTNFIAAHLNRHSQRNTVLLHTRQYDSEDVNHVTDHLLALVNPVNRSVIELDNHPFPFDFGDVVVGSCNGIVCLRGESITLWNPAMRQSKTVPLPDQSHLGCVHSDVSIGFAYDSKENDFLILSIFWFTPHKFAPDEVQMCSTKSLTWKKLKNELGFRPPTNSCDVIVKGVPYWCSFIEDEFGIRQVSVFFDAGRKVFDKLPLPPVFLADFKGRLVDLKDSLGMVLRRKNNDSYVDVWVMDDEGDWSKKYIAGPLVGVDKVVGCSRNGDVVAENDNGELMLLDPVTSSVKVKAEFHFDNAKPARSLFFSYSESLVLTSGMMPVKKPTASEKLARENLLKRDRCRDRCPTCKGWKSN